MVILLGFGPGDGGSTPLGTTTLTFFRYYMKKLLLIGINTRSMLNSALKLDYEIYSTSYFSTSDTKKIKNEKIILKESSDESCGVLKDKFTSKNLIDISKDYINEVDYIIPISGVSPSDFKKKDRKKILGTVDVRDIENKQKFFKKIKDEFLTPETFCILDIDEAVEINKNYPNKQFILKPIQGSGGYDVNLLNNDSNIQLNDNEFIMQEYVEGINLSSSILKSSNNVEIVTNSRLFTINDYKHNNDYRYVGNITPLTKEILGENIPNINEISKKLAKKFNLVGSNGIDYIYNENGLYVIEINPRIQGTFECVEKSFGINMLDKHIKSSLGDNVKIPEAMYYSYKKIIYAPKRVKYSPIDLNNIYDLPHIGSITEKEEPLLTIIDKSKSLKDVCKKVELTSKIVNQKL